jgi:hypothetical protein
MLAAIPWEAMPLRNEEFSQRGVRRDMGLTS